MAVIFVQPRTRIRGPEPISSAPGASSFLIDPEADEEDDLYGDVEMSGMEEHARGSLLTKKLVVPGQLVTDDPQFMRYCFHYMSNNRGHGTYVGEEDKVIASVAGTVQRVNKLLSVKPLKSRYTFVIFNFSYEPQIGDLIIGRISEVGAKRWKVDIASKQDAVLHLASINLPGGILRRRTTDDELQMRTFFTEGDLLVAEVQQLFSDGAASLHTRSLKYGKLRNGLFVAIPPMLVVRSKAHMYPVGAGVHCILGTNGFVWVSKDVKPLSSGMGNITRIEEEASEAIYSNVNEVLFFSIELT
jgi:exosome complex component RRP4